MIAGVKRASVIAGTIVCGIGSVNAYEVKASLDLISRITTDINNDQSGADQSSMHLVVDVYNGTNQPMETVVIRCIGYAGERAVAEGYGTVKNLRDWSSQTLTIDTEAHGQAPTKASCSVSKANIFDN